MYSKIAHSILIDKLSFWVCIQPMLNFSQYLCSFHNTCVLDIFKSVAQSGGRNGTSLQYSCLENATHREASQTTAPVASKNQT